jgi:hypothetical protein
MHDPPAASGELLLLTKLRISILIGYGITFRIVALGQAESNGAMRVCWKLLPE